MPSLHQLALLAHLLAAIVWIGGMVFAHFCLRPAAVELLSPPQRLPLMAGALRRFLRLVAGAIVLVWASGLFILLPVGMKAAPPGWHLMLGLALVMTVVYGLIAHRLLPHLRQACAASDWPAGAAALDRIRRLVSLNLVLGLGVLLAAVSAR
jgi:uncharacterized membrane protein